MVMDVSNMTGCVSASTTRKSILDVAAASWRAWPDLFATHAQYFSQWFGYARGTWAVAPQFGVRPKTLTDRNRAVSTSGSDGPAVLAERSAPLAPHPLAGRRVGPRDALEGEGAQRRVAGAIRKAVGGG